MSQISARRISTARTANNYKREMELQNNNTMGKAKELKPKVAQKEVEATTTVIASANQNYKPYFNETFIRDLAPLAKSCLYGNLEEVKAMLARGEDVNRMGKRTSLTALMCAVKEGQNSIVTLLLKHPRIDVNKKDMDGGTTLHRAAEYDHPRAHSNAMALLLEHPKIDINSTDECGETALHRAVEHDNIKAVKLLLSDHRLTTANHIAISNINSGWTPIMQAIKQNSMEVLPLLANNLSINLDTRDHRGRTLERAARWHQKLIKKIIQLPDTVCNVKFYTQCVILHTICNFTHSVK